MKSVVLVLIALIVSGCLGLRPEIEATGYVGPNFTQDEEGEASSMGASADIDAEYNNQVTGGGRLGVWLSNLGVALDVSSVAEEVSLGAGIADVDLDFIHVSLMPMARLQLGPRGMLQPYVAVGPTAAFSELDLGVGLDFKDSVVGFDSRVGLAVFITDSVGVIGEYRATWVEPEFTINAAGLSADTELEVVTHHLLVGLTFRFGP